MATTLPSPNMILPIPTVGVDTGPDWALNIDACLQLIDSHDHSTGKGVPINSAGLNINASLPMNDQSLTFLKSIQFQTQTSLATPLNMYASGVDLFYNDGNGNVIQITSGGGVAGTPGSIANLVPPASASYVALSESFVWQSDANIAASLDMRNAILRNAGASSKSLTLSPPAAMGSNISMTFPTLPVGNAFMVMDSGGIMNTSAAFPLIGASIASGTITGGNIALTTIAGGQLINNTITQTQLATNAVVAANITDGNVTTNKLTTNCVTTPKIADNAVTQIKLEPQAINTSFTTTSFTTSSGSFVDVLDGSSNILALVFTNTVNRPLIVSLQGTSSGSSVNMSAGATMEMRLQNITDSTTVATYQLMGSTGGTLIPCSSFMWVFSQTSLNVAKTYHLQVRVSAGGGTISVNAAQMELVQI